MKKIISILFIGILLVGSVFAYEDEPSDWAVENIESLKKTDELRDEAFKNYKSNITRKDFIYLAVRIFEVLDGKPINVDESIKFTDTDDIYARKGATVGITAGIGNNKFGPDELLTREQLSVLMINTLKLGNIKLNENQAYVFKDEKTFSSWAKDSIYSAKANNIVSGVGNDNFNSKGNATIEQALIITNKMLKNIDKSSWSYNANIQVVENIKIDLNEDVDDDGELKDYVVGQLWDVFIDKLEFTTDENGIMQVKGYSPKAPKGFTTHIVLKVYFKSMVDTNVGEVNRFTMTSSSTKNEPYQYPVLNGESFNHNMLGKVNNIDNLIISLQVLKDGDHSGNVNYSLSYSNEKKHWITKGFDTKYYEFDWSKIIKW